MVFIFRSCEFTYYGVIRILIQAQVTILWGILDTLTKFLSTVRVWIGSIVELLIFKINIFKISPFIYPPRCIYLKICHRTLSHMIEVVMPPQIPILREFEDQSIVHYVVIVDDPLANMRNKKKNQV